MNARLLLGHALGWSILMLAIGGFSSAPAYRHLGATEATIKLSLSHAGQLLGACRELSTEEQARLPATMRVARDCPRERAPLRVELQLDGREVVEEHVEPRGFHKDGLASMYRRLTVPAGAHELRVRLRDHPDQATPAWQAVRHVDLAPAQVLVIDFDAARGGFRIH